MGWPPEKHERNLAEAMKAIERLYHYAKNQSQFGFSICSDRDLILLREISQLYNQLDTRAGQISMRDESFETALQDMREKFKDVR